MGSVDLWAQTTCYQIQCQSEDLGPALHYRIQHQPGNQPGLALHKRAGLDFGQGLYTHCPEEGGRGTLDPNTWVEAGLGRHSWEAGRGLVVHKE